MEPVHNVAFDFVIVFAPILLIFATCLTVFHRLRARWPVKVNCWFCNENTKISRQNLGWWLCPWCEQYNGFSKNGDYAYDIPEQRTISKMHKKYCKLSERSDKHSIFKNNLCTYCNERESLKLSELSNFEPKNEKLFKAELKAFSEYLEMKYPLCNGCKSTVRNVLHRQALWLTRYKMLFYRKKPINAFIGKARKLETVFRVLSTIVLPMIIYNYDFIWLPISGLFFHLCACWASLTSRRKNSDVFLMFLWFCIISLENLTILHNAWLITEYITRSHMIALCALVIGLVNLRSSSYKNTLTGSVAFKKIKLHTRDDMSPELTFNNQSKKNKISSEANDSIKPSVYTADDLSCTEIKFSKSHSAILRQKLSIITASDSNNSCLNLNSVSQNENNSSDNCCLNDSLSTLLLSEDSPRYSRAAKAVPAIFERKVYNATSNENLFRMTSSKRKCILSPPKLGSVTQTSWVAGGYWQEGMMTAVPPTLSRSSSQSSGFVSVSSSNLAPSREPSVHEFDRCSVVSEATRWSYQTPRSSMACPVVRRDSPISRPQSRYSDAGHSRPILSPTIRAMGDFIQDNYVRGPNDGDRNGTVPVYSGHHTTTIIASPGWLSALLCGSLILNMIVLCTTLLR
ncbi:uncharacterized protein LOC105430327 isoform X2 [Pogonomyrmex barbatus]|uniref:Uncharacterized protein LOC105430327 isoform X2 n=1 Tax=Pogonomyrmex barbatus TaxID=144034 RepID=A0A6I9XBE4_9HYME|nr:uncharacterized protein LOC105430327 isoform X2 [Pogonomyrmex barbatus]